MSCDTCGANSLPAEDIEKLQSAIDNWAIVLETYRSSDDRGEVRTLQAHVNAVLASLDATFQTFQEALDDPGTFSPFLKSGMEALGAKMNTIGELGLGFSVTSSYDSLTSYVADVEARVSAGKQNCQSGSIFSDGSTTCSVFDDMLRDLELASDLLGICDDEGVYDLPSRDEFCQTRSAESLPTHALDALSADSRYVTFGSGEKMELSYSFAQSSKMSQTAKSLGAASGSCPHERVEWSAPTRRL